MDYLIDKTWTLFLDRDGIINRRIVADYVKSPDEFEFLPEVPKAIKLLSDIFGKILVVTNQQGIGKGLMTIYDLRRVHVKLLNEVEGKGGRIDKIYFCPELAQSNHSDRKPGIGMALKAQNDFPEIDFSKSVMVGDSVSDMEFGRNAGMKNIFISSSDALINEKLYDFKCESLIHFTKLLIKH